MSAKRDRERLERNEKTLVSRPAGFRFSRVRFPVGAIAETGTAWGAHAEGESADLFLPANTARRPAGICAGIGSNRR